MGICLNIKIDSTKKRTNFKYDVSSFLDEVKKKYL